MTDPAKRHAAASADRAIALAQETFDIEAAAVLGLKSRVGPSFARAVDLILGFDCILRRLEAEQRQQVRDVSDVLKQHRVVGFSTYGEQFRSMHVNQTFTGVMIGAQPRGAAE